jgi:hypothetical protein
MRKKVYNLEFPSGCAELDIYGYRFVRLPNYEERVRLLQHFVDTHAEFHIPMSSGQHAATALVDLPEVEESAALDWQDSAATALNDILLLISLFRGRDVFTVPEDFVEGRDGIITRDPRQYQYTGTLLTSIPYKEQKTDYFPCNVGFTEALTDIIILIRSDKWQSRYRQGYFLFLIEQALRQQRLELSFIQCWTIWEHLFAVLNNRWLSKTAIRKISALEKIAFILVEFSLSNEISDDLRGRIERHFIQVRNELVHYGRFLDGGESQDYALLFIRLTETVVAKILGLSPSNIFNTAERWAEFSKKP